jgi:thymidylate synthase (FAD)
MGSDLGVVNAARVSFDKESDWEETDLGLTLNDADCKLLSYLATHNHWSPFSHAFASFRIKAPIFVARQLVKHTVGLAWNEVSRRYVSTEPEFYLPDYWRKSASNVKQGSSDDAVKFAVKWYDNDGVFYGDERVQNETQRALSTYLGLLSEGVCAEQARMVLPQNTMTEWIWSGSLYAFARVCNLRLDSHTQKETQIVAEQISKHMSELFPESWKVLVK